MAPYRRFLSPDDANFTFNCSSCIGACVPGIYCEYVVWPSPPPISLNDVVADTAPIAVKSRLVPNLLIAAAAVLSVAFLFLITTYAVHRLRRRRRRSITVTPTDPLPNLDGGDDGEVDHHVWHIRTVGLDESIIQSIATSVYNSKDGLLDGAADCAVCLADIHDGEVLRLLPKCGHAFHVPCIDTWLRSHLNCPLCRAPILAQNTNSENPPLFFPPPPPDMGQITDSVEITQIDVEELEGDQVVPVEEDEIGVNAALASSSSYSAEDGFQPVRRSVSMDSPSLAALLLRAVPEEKFGEETPEIKEEQVIKNGGKQMNAAKWDSLQKGVQGIGRSLSSRSGRFFLSRYGRARNSVLPM